MADFTVLTSAAGTLVVDRPPIVIDRFGDRGKRTQVTASITGKRFLIEHGGTVDNAKLEIILTKLNAAQAETLSLILDAGGVITMRMYSGDTPFSVGYAGDHKVDALIGDYPDKDRDGADLPLLLTPHMARVMLYKL